MVGLAGIRRIGPHRVVDYLCSLLQIDVQSRLQQVHAPLQTGIADLAYASWLEFTVVAHFQAATQIGRGVDLRVDLRLDGAIGCINPGREFP